MMSALNTQAVILLNMKTTLAERLKSAMNEAGLSQAELARRVNVTRSAIAHWLSGATRELKGDHLVSVSAALKVTPTWLAKGTGQKESAASKMEGGDVLVWNHPDELPASDNRVWVDRWDYRFCAGDGGVQWEIRQKNALPFGGDFFDAIGSKPNDCKLVMVRGDSMEPFLFNRDMAMVDTARTRIRDGEVYAMLFEQEPIVKQVFKQPRGLTLHSYNSKYPDRNVAEEDMDRIQIVGEVVYRSGSGFRF